MAHTENFFSLIVDNMYHYGINSRSPAVGRILSLSICPLEAICWVVAQPILSIEKLAQAIFNFRSNIKYSINLLERSFIDCLATIPKIVFAVPKCVYQIFAVLYNPKKVLPLHAKRTFVPSLNNHSSYYSPESPETNDFEPRFHETKEEG